MTTIIEAQGLCKTFKMGNVKIEGLKNIDLKIETGEFVSIMGPSGSGKSTLLYLLGGLDQPTSGRITICGKQLSEMNDRQESALRRKDIGFIFQFYNLIPSLNVEENILLPVMLDKKNIKEYRAKLDEILETVGLSERRNYTPRQLSGGQQQRVAIARALINEPEIILADEPIGNLDSKTGTDIMKLLQKINREQGKTIVQVTHSEEASAYGTKVIRVRDGQIYETNPVNESDDGYHEEIAVTNMA